MASLWYADFDTEFSTTDLVGDQLAATDLIDSQPWTEPPGEGTLTLMSDKSDSLLNELLGLPSGSCTDTITPFVAQPSDIMELGHGSHFSSPTPFWQHQGGSDGNQVMIDEHEPHVTPQVLHAIREQDNEPALERKAQVCAMTPQIVGKKRRTEAVDRTDDRSSPKYARRSMGDSTSVTATNGLYRDSANHEGNALTHNKETSSTTGFEDDVLEDRSIPDSVSVSEQGPLPSQPTGPAPNSGRPKQAPFMSTPFNCSICAEGFKRDEELKKHLSTDKHARQDAQIRNIGGEVKGPRPFKCEQQDCHWAFGRKDALMRHTRKVHKICDERPAKTTTKAKRTKKTNAKTKAARIGKGTKND